MILVQDVKEEGTQAIESPANQPGGDHPPEEYALGEFIILPLTKWWSTNLSNYISKACPSIVV